MRKLFRHGKSFGMVAMAIFLAGALLLGSVMPVKAAEEKVLKIGHAACYTGPLASTYMPNIIGALDRVTYQNEQGGINGVRVEWVWEATRGEVPRSILAFRRAVAQGAVTCLFCNPSATEALTPRFQALEIPALTSCSLTSRMVTQPIRWVFSYCLGSGPEISVFMKWVKDNWTESRPPKVGLIGMEYACTYEGVETIEELAPQMGVEYIGKEIVSLFPPPVDTSTEWLRLAAKQADWVYIFACGASLVTLLKDACRLEIQDRGIRICTYTAALNNEKIAKTIGEKECNGVYSTVAYPSLHEIEGLPEEQLLREVFKKHRAGEEITSGYIMGWLYMATVLEGFRIAVDTVGYENVTGRVVRDSLVRIRGFDTGLMPPITVDEKYPCASRFFKIYRWEGGEMLPVGEWLEPPYLYPELG